MKTQEQLDKEHNGWKGNGTKSSAYATWRVKWCTSIFLEIVDGLDRELLAAGESWSFADVDNPSSLKETVEEMVLHDVDKDSLAASYALALLDDVNWQEIYDHYV